jgi:hypothetical protein
MLALLKFACQICEAHNARFSLARFLPLSLFPISLRTFDFLINSNYQWMNHCICIGVLSAYADE